MLRKIILFISSYIPLYLLMIIKNIVERCTDGGKFLDIGHKIKNMVLFDEVNDWAILVMGALIIISYLYLMRKIRNTNAEVYYEIKEVSDETSNNYFNYISVYLLSCLGLSLNNIVDIVVFILLMIIVGFIYISNDMIYLNPTLNFMKFKVYNVVLFTEATGEVVNSIVIARQAISIEKGKRIKGTRKYELIVVDL